MKIFTYYWRIEHFSSKLKSNVTTIFSPIFTISALNLHVKAILRHLGRDYIFFQIDSIANNQIGDESNVVLATGDAFKEIKTKVLFKHKITVLDQVIKDRRKEKFHNKTIMLYR